MQIKTKLLKCPQILFKNQGCVYTHTHAHTYNQWLKKKNKKNQPFLKAIYFLFLTLKKPFFLFLRVISPAGSCEFPKHLVGKKATKGLPCYMRNSPQEFPERSTRWSEATAAREDEGIWEPRQPITAAGARAPTVHPSCLAAHMLRTRPQTGRLHLSLIWPQCYCYYFPNNN